MSDHSMRAAERTGLLTPKLLRERLRARTISLPWLKIAAYCGSEAAGELVGKGCPRCKGSGGDVVDCSLCNGSGRIHLRLEPWLKGLFTHDPNMGSREERCSHLHHALLPVAQSKHPSLRCDCPGIRQVPWGSDWLALHCAIVAGRMAWEQLANDWECLHGGYHEDGECTGPDAAPDRALDAAQHYLDVGTLVAWEAWHALGFDDTPPWIFGTTTDRAGLISCILATARGLGEECKLYPPPPAHYGFCRSCNGVGRILNEAVIHKSLSNNLVERALR